MMSRCTFVVGVLLSVFLVSSVSGGAVISSDLQQALDAAFITVFNSGDYTNLAASLAAATLPNPNPVYTDLDCSPQTAAYDWPLVYSNNRYTRWVNGITSLRLGDYNGSPSTGVSFLNLVGNAWARHYNATIFTQDVIYTELNDVFLALQRGLVDMTYPLPLGSFVNSSGEIFRAIDVLPRTCAIWTRRVAIVLPPGSIITTVAQLAAEPNLRLCARTLPEAYQALQTFPTASVDSNVQLSSTDSSCLGGVINGTYAGAWGFRPQVGQPWIDTAISTPYVVFFRGRGLFWAAPSADPVFVSTPIS